MTYKKKLIEVALPLDAINDASAYDKMPGIGPHPKGIHQWWAGLPLPSARAVLFASLVDDPDSDPAFMKKSEKAREKERERLFDIIRSLLQKKAHLHPELYADAHNEIVRCCGKDIPTVYDPFCGGGAIPLEAQRLGLSAQASDLNPVAVLRTKALIVIPPRFAGNAPANPDWQKKSKHEKQGRFWNGAQGLAEDVRYYGQWMRDEAYKRIGHLYPKVKLPKDSATADGGEATVIAWLWARTVKCPNPACGAMMPLVRSFALSTKAGKQAWVEPIVDKKKKTVSFDVRTGKGIPQEGTVERKGARCIVCDSPVPFTHIRAEGKAGGMHAELMAIVAEGERGRTYVAPQQAHVVVAQKARPTWKPDAKLPHNPRDFKTPNYGLNTFADLFTPRQLVALTTFSALVSEAREKVLADAVVSGMRDDRVPLDEGGSSATAYADAVATYLAFAVDRCADFNNSICRWVSSNEKVMNLFGRQAIPMVWDYAEANILGETVGSWITCNEYVADCMESINTDPDAKGNVVQLDAAKASISLNCLLVSTDPPYYDNIGYADLSDFFYIWLRRSLSVTYPSLLSTILTPKAQELVATPYRFDGDKKKAEEHFENGFRKTFIQLKPKLDPRFPMTVYYAFKQSEDDEDAGTKGENLITTTGWETMLSALISSGFQITGTWPVRASQAWRMVSMGTNALASYIVLACRPRSDNDPLATRREFVDALRNELRRAIPNLWKANIAPVDLAQASIGPGMAVFSRYSKVMEADGRPMTVRTALGLINQELDEVTRELTDQSLGGEELDSYTRWALTWFEQNGHNEGSHGDAEELSKAKNVGVNGLVQAGIVYSRAGKVRLLKREELDPGWDPKTDKRVTMWEVTQHLIRALQEQGESGAAELLQQVGGELGEKARDLAYRLYLICDRKKWASEALAYNSLVIAWSGVKTAEVEVRTDASGEQQKLGY
jgi:putative DNA methylase